MTAQELQDIRHRFGLTQKALAQRLGVHERTLIKWEQGQRKIPPIAVKLIEVIEGKDDHE